MLNSTGDSPARCAPGSSAAAPSHCIRVTATISGDFISTRAVVERSAMPMSPMDRAVNPSNLGWRTALANEFPRISFLGLRCCRGMLRAWHTPETGHASDEAVVGAP
jgi:hypothetical protein